jgi:FkbM family methyltransferase
VSSTLSRADRPLSVLDLGANIGLFDVYIRSVFPDARITAVEPHPENIAVLRETIDANRQTARGS